MGTDLDLLVIGNCILFKEEQEVDIDTEYKEKYSLD